MTVGPTWKWVALIHPMTYDRLMDSRNSDSDVQRLRSEFERGSIERDHDVRVEVSPIAVLDRIEWVSAEDLQARLRNGYGDTL